MARKKIREYDSKRLLKEHLKRHAGIDLRIRSAQVASSLFSSITPSLILFYELEVDCEVCVGANDLVSGFFFIEICDRVDWKLMGKFCDGGFVIGDGSDGLQ